MREMQPTRFEEIVAVLGLYRPGPMEFIPNYTNRKHGREEITYRHPALEPILAETYGIIVYQEQIIRIAAELAGYTPGEADLMRQAAAFVTWMHETWPSATADIESSGTMLRDGQVISARMDVVVDADDELVMIDHKTLRGEFRPATVVVDYQEQLQLYEELLRAVLPDGRRVRSMVNLVLQGVAVAG